jgi:MFS transporter, PPP family, 3-phenylpropionic acid transporter
MSVTPQVAGRVPLAGFYFLYFGALGITLPFLPAYLASLSLSATQVGVLLALSPVASLVMPPVWGHLADRTGRPDRVLTLISVGACLAFSPLLVAERFATLVAVLATYAVFFSSVTAIADALTLHRVAQVGGSYAHLRLFGSVGFVLTTTLFGLTTVRADRLTVLVPLGLIAAYALWSLTVKAPAAPAPSVSPLAGLRLLGQRDIRLLLGATCLHWVACAPFNGLFSIHVGALGLPPAVVGLSSGLGVAAEVGVMLAYPRLARRIAPRHLLFLAFTASALRWWGMALVESPVAIVALSLLHGMTFGAFYVASVAFMAQRVPAHLRASGQALFVAVSFGLGGLVGFIASGAGYDWLGGHRLFGAAALLEGVAALLVLGVRPPAPGISASGRERPPARTGPAHVAG